MMDSYSDAQDRRRGMNPMSAEYTARVNVRRAEFRIKPLGPDGMPVDKAVSYTHLTLPTNREV